MNDAMHSTAATVAILESWGARKAIRPFDAIARAKAARASILPGGARAADVRAVAQWAQEKAK